MTPTQFNRLLLAPEMIVVELAESTLIALDRALRVEHPLLDAPPPTDHPPVRRHARAILRHADQLRFALRRYRDVVCAILRDAHDRDLPF
jgi:hypothetical protein